ncbi:CarD-like/TRCF domain [uncultured Roseburia sp.]|uniref:CarD family transcriptional regulator n=1 Tax=Brotonthovivens ammoniilytica TaxID=2981725 RepID=A0ABT2THP3_9FIRM|nr:CarD family transcriptional regulator [Brotonthovivens ammoniilytica]MCU6761192.1 CarD family transcriptional regulator [Brotonthovivens ammoniilytica]SCI21528.1 CarD-like/TRCF domain [uncultured Roseburia sp.]
MFQLGDYIVYGNIGVCMVEEVGRVDLPGVLRDRLYYTLQPCYDQRGKIFTPVDNQKVIMRPVLSRKEAWQLIDEMEKTSLLGIQNEKKREEDYRASFQKCDCRELVKLIKTIYLREQKRKSEGKKITSQDERYFHMAQMNLYGELSVSLGIDREEVKELIMEKVH